jgi:hypothetical protein
VGVLQVIIDFVLPVEVAFTERAGEARVHAVYALDMPLHVPSSSEAFTTAR